MQNVKETMNHAHIISFYSCPVISSDCVFISSVLSFPVSSISSSSSAIASSLQWPPSSLFNTVRHETLLVAYCMPSSSIARQFLFCFKAAIRVEPVYTYSKLYQ